MIEVKTLAGYKLQSLDGEIGKVREFYFDDRHWTIRYLVADTGGWLTGRQVLISPYAMVGVNTAEHHITIDLTKKQIESSPSLVFINLSSETIKQSPEYQEDVPLTRDDETRLHGHYHRPGYWEAVAKELAS